MPTSVQVKASKANNSHGLDLAVAQCALDGHSGRADSLQAERLKSEGPPKLNGKLTYFLALHGNAPANANEAM